MQYLIQPSKIIKKGGNHLRYGVPHKEQVEACGFWKEERAHPVRGQLIHRKFAGSDGDGCFATFQSLELVPADFWNIQVGGDVYSANRDAVRTIRRRDNGMLMFEDQIWPDATITDAGLFTRAEHSFNNIFHWSNKTILRMMRLLI